MKIADITGYLDSVAPPSLQENYDNAGLITGNPDDETESVLICLDSTEAVVNEAIALRCKLIIAHHPIVFSGIKKFTENSYVARTIIKAIKNDIAIYAIHTNLDNVLMGVNQKIAEILELNDCRILSPKKGMLRKLVTFVPTEYAAKLRQAIFDAGAGEIGNYDHCSFNLEGSGTFRGNEGTNPFVGEKGADHTENETRIETVFPDYLQNQVLAALKNSHPYEEIAYDIYRLENTYQLAGSGLIGTTRHATDEFLFLRFLKSKMNVQTIRHTALRDKKVERVAVCGGSGSFLLNEAIAAGADVLVTSDFKYHQFFDADGKIVIADIGHYESEQFTISLLAEFLQKKFPTFALHFTKVNTNPINYL